MDFKDIFVRLMFVGIIFLSILSWIILTQEQNDTTNLITNNTLINKTFGDLNTNLAGTQIQADTASSNFGNVTPTDALGIVSVQSVVSPTRIFKSLILGTYNILIALPAQFLGIPVVVIAMLNAILTLFLILGIWAIWKGVFRT
ncbi:hypothetical protein LCGC14_1402380 [marine sediment metagenome]|uniref:Uncharacterized protein n=1 Tax=marine sediment metagenome TaxID=412755 RepID=A0A0F9JWX9_9ZZZZ